MATTVYKNKIIKLVDGTELDIVPLKIKYLREFMEAFEYVKTAKDDDEAIDFLVECVRITMKQYYPGINLTKSDVEDSLDMPTIYTVLDISAGIKINQKSEETVKDQATDSGSSWSELDLAKIESEVFLLGIWKDYRELEESLSMPELIATLSSRRDLDYEEKKFLAAIQGVDIEKNKPKEEDPWLKLKNKVFNEGRDDKDILTFKGAKAARAGFGIGMGLDYENLT